MEYVANPPKIMPATYRPEMENMDKPSLLAPGDWTWSRDRTYVAGRCPNGAFVMLPVTGDGWTLVNGDPAAIHLMPSIEVNHTLRETKPERYWHGYLDGAVWRFC